MASNDGTAEGRAAAAVSGPEPADSVKTSTEIVPVSQKPSPVEKTPTVESSTVEPVTVPLDPAIAINSELKVVRDILDLEIPKRDASSVREYSLKTAIRKIKELVAYAALREEMRVAIMTTPQMKAFATDIVNDLRLNGYKAGFTPDLQHVLVSWE